MAEHVDEGQVNGGFLAARWRGAVPLDRLFWFDTILVGSAINIVAAFASVLMFGFKLPVWAAVAVYLAPMPYNIFLVLALWRTSEAARPSVAMVYRLGALAWLAASVLV